MDINATLPICNQALAQGYGFVRDLHGQMSDKDIKGLELQGFIKNAMSAEGDTWKLTKRGKMTRDILLGNSNKNFKSFVGDLLCRILRIKPVI